MPSSITQKLERVAHDAWGSWCARFGAPLQVVRDSPAILERVTLRPAATQEWVNPLDEAFFGAGAGRMTAAQPGVSFLHLRDVSVTGSDIQVFAGPHTLLRLDATQDGHPLRKVRRPLAPLSRRLDGSTLLLGSRNTDNHAHFVFEHLPLVLLAREHLGRDVPLRILVNTGQGHWQREYLARLGEDPARIVEVGRGTLRCADLWFIPNVVLAEKVDLYEPALYREIARRLKRGARPAAGGQLFLTRRDAARRRLLNEDEVFERCRAAWPRLRRVALAGMSLQQQIDLFAGAEVILGPISQAFTNVLFASGALCVQFVPGRRDPANSFCRWALNYDRLGLVNGNRCLALHAEQPYEVEHHDDFSYPLADLDRALERIPRLAETA